MPSYTIKANGEVFGGGDHPEERTRIVGPTFEAGTDQHEVYSDKPQPAMLTISRNLPEDKGDFVLLRVAVASQAWDNSDSSPDRWPSAELIFDKQQGRTRVQVQRHDLRRLYVENWGLSWSAGGPFAESLVLKVYEVTKTSLIRNDSVTVKITPVKGK